MPIEDRFQHSRDTASRSELGRVESDGRAWTPIGGTWSANGSQLTTSTARGSDPRIIVVEPYSDFDMQVDVGYGDSVYFRHQDTSNYFRLNHYQNYSSVTSYAGEEYASTYNYTEACGYYDCSYYSGTHQCNCVENSFYGDNMAYGRTCYYSSGAFGFQTPTSYNCGGCPFTGNCPAGLYKVDYCYYSNKCYVTYGQYTCQTCPTLVPATCTTFCNRSTTNYRPYYSTAYYYPTYLNLQKVVGGTLSDVSTVNTGENGRVSWVRIVGKGQNIKVYSSLSPSTPHIDVNTTDLMYGQGYGVGRTGYGNQDTGAVLDNITIKMN